MDHWKAQVVKRLILKWRKLWMSWALSLTLALLDGTQTQTVTSLMVLNV